MAQLTYHKNCTDLINNLVQVICFKCVEGIHLYHVEVMRKTTNTRQDTQPRYKFNALIHQVSGYQLYKHRLLPLLIHSYVWTPFIYESTLKWDKYLDAPSRLRSFCPLSQFRWSHSWWICFCRACTLSSWLCPCCMNSSTAASSASIRLLLAERSVRNFCNKQISKDKFIPQFRYCYSPSRQMLVHFNRPRHFLPHSFQLLIVILPSDST